MSAKIVESKLTTAICDNSVLGFTIFDFSALDAKTANEKKVISINAINFFISFFVLMSELIEPKYS